MRVAIYIRVSTQEQAKEGYSVGEQTERLEKYCEAMGWTIYKIYVDPGYSGGNTDRPGLQEMIKDIRAGKISKVVVYKLDRLSRSQLDTLYLIEKEFLANGTDFVSMSENFDTGTPFGRAMIGILAVFAQLEREQIKERMSMGKEARAKEGKWHGGSTQPIGYDYNTVDDMLYINKYEAMQVAELYNLFLRGVPLRAIENLFDQKGYRHKHGKWNPKTMRSVMQNKTNIGYVKYNETWYKGLQDPIIDDETFYKACKLLEERSEQFKEHGVKPGAQKTYLGGLLYCKHCGGKYAKVNNYNKRKNGAKISYYKCYSRSKKMKLMIKDPNCKNKIWRIEDLDALVFDEIKKFAIDPQYLAQLREEKKVENEDVDKIEILKKEIANLEDQISRYMDLYAIKKITIDAVTKKIEPLEEQKERLSDELSKLTNVEPELTDSEVMELAESFNEALESGEFETIRLLIDTMIEYIELDDETVYIHWKFI